MTDLHVSFSVLHAAIKQARYNALKVVNAELINLYWQTGAFVRKRLSKSEWGDKSVQQLSDFLRREDPALKGFDRKSIYRMVQFYDAYAQSILVFQQSALKKTEDNQPERIVTSVRRQLKKNGNTIDARSLKDEFFREDIRNSILVKISWTNNRTIISRCRTDEERIFYIQQCIRENYSVKELERQISASLYERTALSNQQLSPALKARHPNFLHSFKDSYVFEFLNLPEPHNECSLQKALITQMKRFVLELGKDFLFIAEEYKLQVGSRDFFIDLLFYHRGLQCLVAFDLKKERFEPEFLGKMNFYLEALDRDVKRDNEQPSIGILLCKNKDTEVVEYALSRSLSPAMVAEYRTQLPDKKLLENKLHEFSAMGLMD